MIPYDFIIQDKQGGNSVLLDAATQRSYELYLNKPGSASFTLSLNDPKITPDLITLCYTELYIYRDGGLVWGGEIQLRRTTSAQRSSTLTANGWLVLLDKRQSGTKDAPRIFTATDASQIVAALIAENSDLGFTMGAAPVAAVQTQAYQYKNVKEAIEDASNLHAPASFDFEISADKKVNTFVPQRGSVLKQIVFEYGVNMLDYTLTEDGTDMVNEIVAQGAGNGTSMLVSQASSANYLQQSYKRRSATPAYKDVEVQATLDKYAQRDLQQRQVPQVIATITVSGSQQPAFGAYNLGDIVPVKIVDGWVRVDSLYRIYGMKVNVSNNNEETIQLIFNPN